MVVFTIRVSIVVQMSPWILLCSAEKLTKNGPARMFRALYGLFYRPHVQICYIRDSVYGSAQSCICALSASKPWYVVCLQKINLLHAKGALHMNSAAQARSARVNSLLGTSNYGCRRMPGFKFRVGLVLMGASKWKPCQVVQALSQCALSGKGSEH